jgi:glycosyltransferase involved in cell wall biosynthesis
MPIDWPEPFGLVMIEAAACGTPVIAFNHGSVPEIVEDGVTGFIVDNEAEAVAALARVPTLNRDKIRAEFIRRFSARRMAQDYLNIYESLLVPQTDRLRLVG